MKTAVQNKSRPSRVTGQYRPTARSRVTNGKVLLPGIDGRSVWVRRFRDLISLHLSDLGGEDGCSESEKALVRRSACLVVELERLELLFAQAGGSTPQLLENYQRCANTLRRLLESLGLQRRPRDVTPSIDEYLRHVARQRPKDNDIIDGEDDG